VTYAEALTYLLSLQQFGFKPGLESTRRLASLVGNPHESLHFIHVAGTNGKGSVCAMLDAIHRTAGRRVGLYTSPHLIRFNERIRVDGTPIPDEALARLTARLRAAVEAASPKLEPTFFEFTTVLALLWFAESRVDLVVWETGLGGRFDATNIVTPLASVVTQIGLDHMAVLGPTIGAIAAEKAGIFKPDVPALTSATDPDALAILEFKARETGSPFIPVGHLAVEQFRLELPLLGEHQRTNAALAAAAIRVLRFLLPVSDEQMARGFASVRWPGRLQVLQRGKQTLLLDGAHNRDGIASLRAALERHFPNRAPVLVLGMLADKEWRDMARMLAPLASRIITTRVSSTRTIPPEDLKDACLTSGVARPIRITQSVSEALRGCTADPFVVVTGSLYLIGEALEVLGEGAGTVSERHLNEWSPPGASPSKVPSG
jgi:dihydrofolate synthase/folylpolyglutamate synthase